MNYNKFLRAILSAILGAVLLGTGVYGLLGVAPAVIDVDPAHLRDWSPAAFYFVVFFEALFSAGLAAMGVALLRRSNL